MFKLSSIIKKLIPLIIVFAVMVPEAFAAKYYLTDNDNLVRGCNGTIEIKVDTEGSNVIAGDSTILISSSQVTVNQLSIGSPLPMQTFSQITDNKIKLSGSRMPMTGSFSGVGTFGYINFTPSITATSGNFTFSSDFDLENNMVDDDIKNVLNSAISKTYTFKNRYDKDVNGVGFCTQDKKPPTIRFITPAASSANNPADTNIIFTLKDDRKGVDINTLDFFINGSSYKSSPNFQVSIQEDEGLYRVEADPNADFNAGDDVVLRVNVCQKGGTEYCTDRTVTFKIYEPPVPEELYVCGNGKVEPQNGEQCEPPNPGKGCDSFCLLETPPSEEIPACDDGIHNQDEQAIDCGGPCLKPCPTCVDGILNQDEESVDCGGPCPPCGEVVTFCPTMPTEEELEEEVAPTPGVDEEELRPVACIEPEFDLITVCHYLTDDPDAIPYSLVIRDIDKDTDEFKDDTVGPCTLEDVTVPVEQEIEDNAIAEAEIVYEEVEAIEEIGTAVISPETQAEVLSRIDICKMNPDYAGADFDDRAADTDEDGLTDRMECYAETHPLQKDSDGDSCEDSDELNQFNTDPLNPEDCSIISEEEDDRLLQVIISDPKPGWTLGEVSKIRFAGTTPTGTEAITITAFHADQKMIKALGDGIFVLLRAFDLNTVQSALDDLDEPLQAAKEFLQLNAEDFEYAGFSDAVAELDTKIEDLREQIENTSAFDMGKKQEDFGNVGSKLSILFRSPVVMGSTQFLQENALGSLTFQLVANSRLEDQKLYDVVATATFGDGMTVNSALIRFGVNTGLAAKTPIPKTLGGKLIPGRISLNGKFIGDAFAQGEDGRSEMEIDDDRPTITGDTEFGSQVYAIWNSIVLASSVISDSEEGAFQIQAPRALEDATHHRVTLYAVKKTSEDATVRSESVDVYFRIKSQKVNYVPVAVGLASLALMSFAFMAVRRMRLRASVKVLKLLRPKK